MAATMSFASPTVSSPFFGRKMYVFEFDRFFYVCSSIQRGNSNSSLSVPGSFSRRLNLRAPRCAYEDGGTQVFPRLRVWDPYKRLGITGDASEDEVWNSRNFLVDQYAGHEQSYESIEAAFEKILMASYRHRKKTKINLKTQLKKKVEESPPWIKNLLSFVEFPPGVIILRRFFLFGFMACWSVMNSAQAGPAFQVAISLAACIYFLNDKMKSVPRSAITHLLQAGLVDLSLYL
ncbi:tyrosine/serine/threonine protein phosphatase [Orobanche minor]